LNLTYSNQAGLELFGYTKQDLKAGINGLELLHPDDREKSILRVASHFEGKYVPPIEYRALKKDSSIVPILFRAIPALQKGEIAGFRASITDISGLKAAEENLRKSDEKYKTLVDTTSQGIQVTDLEGKIIFSNSSHNKILGYPEDELIGKFVWEFIAEEQERLKTKDYYEMLITSQIQPTPYFSVNRTKDGRLIHLEINWNYLRDAKGILTGITSVINDVTERKQAEEALKESEVKYRTLVDEVKEGFYVSDLHGVLTFANRALAHIFGFEHPDEILGKKFTTFLPPEKVNELFKQYQVALASGTGSKIIFTEIIRQDGASRFIEIKPQIILEDGKSIGIRGLISDITERKQAEDALLENQYRFEKSQELGHVGNWEYNLESELFWVSDESKRIYGLNLDSNSYSIKFVENCIPERERVHQALIDLIGHDKKYDLEFEIIPVDKTPRKIIHSIAELERDASNNPLRVRGVILDITERKQAEEQIKANLKEKETLMLELAHRTKNNMSVISSLLGLQISSINDEKAKEALKDSQNRVQSMSSIHEVLYQSKNLSSVDMNTYLSNLSGAIAQNYTISSKVNVRVESENILIGAKQASPLGLVVNELITNSFKYAFPENQEGEIKISLTRTEDQVELEYTDNGKGMPKDFDWHKAKSMGLKLVRTLVENQLDGSIDMESNNGTKFTIKFDIEN